MNKKSGDFYRLYQLAYQDRFSFYRTAIFIGLIFFLFFISCVFSFKLVKEGFVLKNFLIVFFSYLVSFSLLCFLAIGSRIKNLILAVFLLPIAFICAFFYLSFPLEFLPRLVIFYFSTVFLLLFSVLLFRQENNLLVHLSFYRIFKRGSWFLAFLIFITFYLLLSWQYSLTLNNLGDYLIDHIPLPFNYSLNEFLIKNIKGEIGLPLGISFSQKDFSEEFEKMMEELEIERTQSSFVSEKTYDFQEKVEGEVLAELKGKFSEFFGKQLKGDENMNQLIKDYLKNGLSSSFNIPLFRWFYLAILLILAFSIIGVINSLLGIFVSLLIHVLLLPLFLKLKILKIEKREIEKDALSI